MVTQLETAFSVSIVEDRRVSYIHMSVTLKSLLKLALKPLDSYGRCPRARQDTLRQLRKAKGLSSHGYSPRWHPGPQNGLV